jgi:hypothetical protein
METVEVEKPLGWFQKTFIWIGVLSFVALLGVAVWKTKKWWHKLL